MTQIFDRDQKCSVCGNSSPQPVLASTNAWGYADLDLRPPEMQRSTMTTWIVECPHCGYVSSRLEKELEIPKDFLKSEEYLTCDGHDFIGNLSKKFYKRFLIARQADDTEECFKNLLHCAWDCDDRKDSNATDIRKEALKYVDELIRLHGDANDNFICIKADLLRRSGQFDKLIEDYSGMTTDEDVLNKIIEFQIGRAREKDTECYTIEDVIK
jgi:hypothetical protein